MEMRETRVPFESANLIVSQRKIRKQKKRVKICVPTYHWTSSDVMCVTVWVQYRKV